MKNHLKRLTAPKQWNFSRKGTTFVLRPNPGAHSLDMGMPLGVVIRDVLHLTKTLAEAKKLIHGSEILVDGVRRTDHRHIVGLFDVLSITPLKKNYRFLLDQKGRLLLQEITATESSLKPCQVVGKSVMRGGKIQYNLHDGKNVFLDGAARVGDTVLLDLPSLQAKEILPLKPGATVFVTRGRRAGDVGVLKSIKGGEVTYAADGGDVDTLKKYLFVLGHGKPVIALRTTP
ncbi:30S ribosomal protein S4e [Candidatus Woesearchaeota archaeon]|nr:30S ribosomal protein S4e [Candidatus Woesearchaeota archaeon]